MMKSLGGNVKEEWDEENKGEHGRRRSKVCDVNCLGRGIQAK